jgi:hypothetical protein
VVIALSELIEHRVRFVDIVFILQHAQQQINEVCKAENEDAYCEK